MPTIRVPAAVLALVLLFAVLLELGRAQQPQTLLRLTPEQSEILAHMSLVDLDDGFGHAVRTLRISGLNVQVVNGLGATASTNGAGNLILGYAEANVIDLDRRGSHNLVVGPRNSYASFGGLVAGERNRLEAPSAAVTGGTDNRAAALYSAVCGGTDNLAGDAYTVVVGGVENEAAYYASAILGGELNRASGYAASVSGGRSNAASAEASSVTGGDSNTAQGNASTVSGGAGRAATDDYDWVAGSLLEDF